MIIFKISNGDIVNRYKKYSIQCQGCGFVNEGLSYISTIDCSRCGSPNVWVLPPRKSPFTLDTQFNVS